MTLFSGFARSGPHHEEQDQVLDTAKHIFKGELQLVIPAWRIGRGYVKMWQAIVQGSISSDIHFQILTPVDCACKCYKVHHQFSGIQSGNIINVPPFKNTQNSVVGILLRTSEADNMSGLKYSNATTTGDEVDVYYWRSSMARTFFEICSNTESLHGITPMVSWKFCS